MTTAGIRGYMHFRRLLCFVFGESVIKVGSLFDSDCFTIVGIADERLYASSVQVRVGRTRYLLD